MSSDIQCKNCQATMPVQGARGGLTVLDQLERHVRYMRDAAEEGTALHILTGKLQPILPLLRTLVDADTAWTEAVIGASTISFEECTRRAAVADDAVQTLLAALRAQPTAEGQA